MMEINIQTIGEFCSIAFGQTVHTLYATFWQIVVMLWPWYWLGIVLGLSGWVVYEVVTRHRDAHFNSENGFSPLFNSVVGSGTYMLLQALFFVVVVAIFGPGVYCFVWPLPIHVLIFLSTGRILNFIGFWPRLEKPGQRRRYRRRRRRY